MADLKTVPICFLIELNRTWFLSVSAKCYFEFVVYNVMVSLSKRGESFGALYKVWGVS